MVLDPLADGTQRAPMVWSGSETNARLDDLEWGWTVLRPDGRPVRVLSLPVYRLELLRIRGGGVTGWAAVEDETTIPSARHELLDVTGGRIAVLRTDELGEEFIEVYEVENPR